MRGIRACCLLYYTQGAHLLHYEIFTKIASIFFHLSNIFLNIPPTSSHKACAFQSDFFAQNTTLQHLTYSCNKKIFLLNIKFGQHLFLLISSVIIMLCFAPQLNL